MHSVDLLTIFVVDDKCWPRSLSDGQINFGQTATMTFSDNGLTTVTLTVTDNDGLTASAQKTITVEKKDEAPLASFTATPMSGSVPLTTTLNAAGSIDPDGSIVNYEWSSSDGQIYSGLTATMKFITSGSYTVYLTVSDDDGLTSTASRTVSVEAGTQPPTASFTLNPTTGIAPLIVNLDGSGATDSDGFIIDYAWSSSNGQSSSGLTAAMVFSSPGTYTITLLVTDNDGLMTSTEQSIVVGGCSDLKLALCITEAECSDVGGNWCSDSCSIEKCSTSDDDLPISNTCSGPFDSCVMLSTNGDFFDIGEQFSLDLELNVNQNNRFERVDLYVAVKMPDSTMLFFTEDSLEIFSDMAQPFKSSLEDLAVSYHIFDFEVIPDIGGTYTVYAALNLAGEPLDIFKLLSNIAIVEFIFRN